MAGTQRVVQRAEPGTCANAPPDTTHPLALGEETSVVPSMGWTASASTAKRGPRTVLTVLALWGPPAFLEILLQQLVPGPASDAALRAPGFSACCLTRAFSFLSQRAFPHHTDTTRRCLWKALPGQLNTFVAQIANAAASQHSQTRHWEEKTE